MKKSNPANENVLALTAAQCAGLVENIGSSGLVPALLKLGHEVCRADFVSIFCQGDRDVPLLVGTDSCKGKRRAEQAAQGYTRHIDQDPNTALLSGSKGEGDFLTHQDAADIKSFTYRRDCYDLPGIAGRTSLVRRTSTYGLSVSLYTAEETGVFDQPNRAKAEALLAFLLPAIQASPTANEKLPQWRSRDAPPRRPRRFWGWQKPPSSPTGRMPINA